MRYGSLFSGIEAMAVAMPHWEPAYVAEIDPFCCRLLARTYPDVPNYGDVSAPRQWPAVDVLVGGPPCQSYSINGKGKGLADDQTALSFVEVIRRSKPRAFILENVPNILRTNGGRDWGTILRAVDELGYGVAWRVLNLRHFGIPQRRRRLFAVGVLNGQSAARILFESTADTAPHSAIGKARQARPATLAYSGDESPKIGIEVCPTLRASQGGEGVGIITKHGARRLTISEWERLQGFPVGYTACGTLRERRRALGNSFPPPVLAWIGKRLEAEIMPSRKAVAKPAPAPAQIITLQRISSQLATITTVDDAKALRDKAEALRVYYQQVGNAKEIERQAIVVRLRAERRIGELLTTTITRGNPKLRSGLGLPDGITYDQSSKWQLVAKVPEPTFEKYLESRGQLSTKGAISLARKPAAESVEALAERAINRLRAQIAERLGCDTDSKRVDRVLAAAVNRMKIAV